MSNTWGACPLATYLREAHDAYDIRVGEHTYRMLLPEGDTGECPLPDWAARFVDYVDAGPDLRQVTVAEALELLERVTAAEALELLERAAPVRVGTDPEGGSGRSTPGGQMSGDAVSPAPSAARSTICARRARCWELVRARTIRANRARSSRLGFG
jgi:hypothetical protein